MILASAESGRNVDLRTVIHNYFNRSTTDPGTWKEIILGIAALLIFLVILHIFLYAERRSGAVAALRDPGKLFAELLRKLPLNRVQRGLLSRLAHQIRPDCPAALLLCPRMFADATRQWLASSTDGATAYVEELRTINEVLFPPLKAEPPFLGNS